MFAQYVIRVEYPVRARKGETRGKNGLLQKCVVFRGATKADALADAARWEEQHTATPYGEIVARGWDAV